MLYSTFLLNTLQNELFLRSMNTYYAMGKSIKREVRAPSKRRSKPQESKRRNHLEEAPSQSQQKLVSARQVNSSTYEVSTIEHF